MKKRLISLIVAVVMLFSMLCPAAYADDGTVSFDTCSHEWETPIRSGYSYTIPNTDVSFGVKVEQCKKCKWYKHVASIIIAEYTYYSPFNVDENGLIPTELATVWANVWYKTFGKNATATKFTPGGGSTSGGGVGRPKGYDDNGTALVSNDGMQRVRATFKFFLNYDSDKQPIESFTVGSSQFYAVGTPGQVILTSENNSQGLSFSGGYFPVTQLPGYYTLPAGTEVYNFNYYQGTTNYPSNPNVNTELLGYGLSGNYKTFYVSSTNSKVNFFYVSDYSNKSEFCVSSSSVGNSGYTYTFKGWGTRKVLVAPHDIYLDYTPDKSSTNIKTYTRYNITNNNINNTWNGNIYTDNSTNLTYIYPQYTTVNEKNETVTNISTTPIIYNNETKQYYTYDQTTKNYYYITYNTQPTPSPSPTPAPTEKPGGSISTPETGKPGGDAGDTTGILAVLVEIRDNMVQGFLDIKAAFVAGFAELSANFTLAIENLNVNIQNTFNKKFPDQSTPETALPSPTPSPSPAPLDPIIPETQNLIIPKMNSNTFTDEHGTWIASGSSKYSDVFDFFRAFDRSTSEIWETNVSPSYLQIEIPDPENYYVDGYIMRISKFDNRYAKDWTLQGSDDGETWDDLDTQNGQNLSDKEEHKYTLTLRKAYKYYRLNMSNYASSMCSLSHFNLLGYDAKDVVTPTPSPTDPPSPTPAPTSKPDSGDKTNNFWTIIFPNGGGSEDGKKGIFWALVSLILALIAFFANLAVGVGYLFPFLPDGVVMTINTCLIVIFLFTIIKFIMRSK